MDGYNNKPLIIYGTTGRVLAENIYKHLSGEAGESPINESFDLGPMEYNGFPSGEFKVTIGDSARERHVYVVQSNKNRVNDAWELLVINDAAKRAHAGKIINVISNYPFARQDRKASGREPITAKLYARLLETSGAHSICTMDLHAAQIQGFFEIPCDNLEPLMLFAHDMQIEYPGFENVAFVAPDEGSWKRIKDVVKEIGIDIPIAVINKKRVSGKDVEVYDIIGKEFLEGKHAIMLDDEIDTAGSVWSGTEALMELKKPPKTVECYASHGTFSDPAYERLDESSNKYGLKIVTTDTIPQDEKPWKKVISVAPMFAHALDRIEGGGSVSELFRMDTFEKIVYGEY